MRRRRRAIRYRVPSLTAEKVVERTSTTDREKLEITCEIGARRARLRIFIWEDRWIWVDARRPSKVAGWSWQFTREGRVVGGLDGRRLVQVLEASVDAASSSDEDAARALDEVWQSIFAIGPCQ